MTADIPVATTLILTEVAAERLRQDEKWGEQNHPLVDELLRDRPHERMALEYEIPTALRATWNCETAFKRGEGTWLHILVEELSEFMGAAQSAHIDPTHARHELVQVAASAIAAIEAIDRNTAATEASDGAS